MVVFIGPISCNLNGVIANSGTDGAKGTADIPVGVNVGAKDGEGFIGVGRGGEVKIHGFAAQKCVANRPADQRKLVPGLLKDAPERDKKRTVGSALQVGQCLFCVEHALIVPQGKHPLAKAGRPEQRFRVAL